MTAIPAALEHLHAAIHELSIIADNLVGRLTPVLMPAGPEPGDTTGKLSKVDTGSPHALTINGMRCRVENVMHQLRDTANRLEA